MYTFTVVSLAKLSIQGHEIAKYFNCHTQHEWSFLFTTGLNWIQILIETFSKERNSIAKKVKAGNVACSYHTQVLSLHNWYD